MKKSPAPDAKQQQTYVAGMSEEELRRKYDVEEIVKIGSNENPLGPSPMAIEAMHRVATNLHRYPPMSDDTFRDKLADSVGRGVTRENIVTGNGGCDILSMIAYAYLDDKKACVICPPTFPVYEFTAKRSGAEVIHAHLSEPGFAYDVDAILNVVTEKTRLVYVCSPNNPTGSYLTGLQMEELVGALPPEVLIVFDEVYHHFLDVENRFDPVRFVTGGKRIILVHSFSKAYGLAGCRLGYGIAAPDIVREVDRYRLPFHLNKVTLEAGLAALDDSDHLERTISTVVSGRAWLLPKLVEAGTEAWPSQGNFILFRTGFPADKVVDRLLRHGVIVRPMENFYLPEHLRVTVGRSAENERFVDSLNAVLSDLRN